MSSLWIGTNTGTLMALDVIPYYSERTTKPVMVAHSGTQAINISFTDIHVYTFISFCDIINCPSKHLANFFRFFLSLYFFLDGALAEP